MNFDSFLKKYAIEVYTHSVVMERETLLHMLEDLYTQGYDDGKAEKYLKSLIDVHNND